MWARECSWGARGQGSRAKCGDKGDRRGGGGAAAPALEMWLLVRGGEQSLTVLLSRKHSSSPALAAPCSWTGLLCTWPRSSLPGEPSSVQVAPSHLERVPFPWTRPRPSLWVCEDNVSHWKEHQHDQATSHTRATGSAGPPRDPRCHPCTSTSWGGICLATEEPGKNALNPWACLRPVHPHPGSRWHPGLCLLT